MGWSGKGILDGDTPMDVASYIADICGCPKNYEGSSDDFLTKENLEKYQADILKFFKKKKVSIIYVQTFAAYMVSVGAVFNEISIEDCIRCLKDDEWAKSDLERKYHIYYLINILENYKNEPTSYYDLDLDYDYRLGITSKYAMHILEIFKKTDFFKHEMIISSNICIMGGSSYGIVVLFKEIDNADIISDFFKNCISNFFELSVVYISSEDFILNPNSNV